MVAAASLGQSLSCSGWILWSCVYDSAPGKTCQDIYLIGFFGFFALFTEDSPVRNCIPRSGCNSVPASCRIHLFRPRQPVIYLVKTVHYRLPTDSDDQTIQTVCILTSIIGSSFSVGKGLWLFLVTEVLPFQNFTEFPLWWLNKQKYWTVSW